MSRTLASLKGSSSVSKQSTTSQYKLFIWDVGTDSREPSESAIRTLAAIEYSSPTTQVTHFSTAVRPSNVTTTRETPTFPEAWDSFRSYIVDYSAGKQPLLVSHNASFDVTVLLSELRRASLKIPSDWRFSCSLLFSRSVFPFSSDNSQVALTERLGMSVKHHHHTSEDVIVLRKVLIAIDDDAIDDDEPWHRVIPALSRSAHPPAFFDRTPQDSSSSQTETTRTPKFFITQTGTKYHRGGCKWLSRSKIPRYTAPQGFLPCRVCRPDDENYDVTERADEPATSNKHGAEGPAKPSSASPSSLSQFFITKTGSKYHVEGCKWLSRSKIPIDTPPAGMKPCGTCTGGFHPSSRSLRESSPSSLSVSAENGIGSSDDAPFFVTKTGSKYHLKGCKSLARSRIPQYERPSGYDPCGICLPNLAYTGSPEYKKLPR